MTGARRPNVLMLGTYPIKHARHGGPKRVHALLEQYRHHLGNVRYVAVYSRWANPQASRSDIAVSRATDKRIIAQRELEDVYCGQAIMNDPSVKQRFTKLLTSFRPDVIQLEQVYPYLGLKPLLDELGLSPKIVFSTHNVEAVMKRDVYARLGLTPERESELIELIESTERELAASSSLLLAVSDEDAEVYRGYGAKNVVVARNGSDRPRAARADASKWRRRFAGKHLDHTYLFVSSAHLPNWYGFQEIVGNGLGFLYPNERIVLAGAISEYAKKLYTKPSTPDQLAFLRRTMLVGRLSDNQLAGLYEAAGVVLLPITGGGGSNLKTAEALLAGKKIVATSFALRAFEQFGDYPNLWIADTPAEFRSAMREATTAELKPYDRADKLESLTWSACLLPVIKEMREL